MPQASAGRSEQRYGRGVCPRANSLGDPQDKCARCSRGTPDLWPESAQSSAPCDATGPSIVSNCAGGPDVHPNPSLHMPIFAPRPCQNMLRGHPKVKDEVWRVVNQFRRLFPTSVGIKSTFVRWVVVAEMMWRLRGTGSMFAGAIRVTRARVCFQCQFWPNLVRPPFGLRARCSEPRDRPYIALPQSCPEMSSRYGRNLLAIPHRRPMRVRGFTLRQRAVPRRQVTRRSRRGARLPRKRSRGACDCGRQLCRGGGRSSRTGTIMGDFGRARRA